MILKNYLSELEIGGHLCSFYGSGNGCISSVVQKNQVQARDQDTLSVC